MYSLSLRARHAEGLESILTKIECDSTQSVMTQRPGKPLERVKPCLSFGRSRTFTI